ISDLHSIHASLRLLLLYLRSGAHPHPHSLPTRRSSDLPSPSPPRGPTARARPARPPRPPGGPALAGQPGPQRRSAGPRPAAVHRSEEHTSELQSRENLVCRLLLEKKKKKEHKT